MKLDKKSAFLPLTAEKIPADPLHAFVMRNGNALWEAVRFISGYETSRLVDKCVAHLERDGRLKTSTRLMIDQIHSILSLEQVDDPEMPFMDYFAVVNPADLVVEEICLLCDRLSAALAESARRQRQEVNANTDPRAA